MKSRVRGPLRKRKSHLWVRDEHDWYVEPAWCAQRLFDVEQFVGRIKDPACGCGTIVRAARAAGHIADGTDLMTRRRGFKQQDFFTTTRPVANFVSNPPFRWAWAFVTFALVMAERKVAMLLPTAWIQGDVRSRWLEATPLRRVWFLSPRPAMPPGHLLGKGKGNGTTDYAWFVWERGYVGAPEMGSLRRSDPAKEEA